MRIGGWGLWYGLGTRQTFSKLSYLPENENRSSVQARFTTSRTSAKRSRLPRPDATGDRAAIPAQQTSLPRQGQRLRPIGDGRHDVARKPADVLARAAEIDDDVFDTAPA